MRYHTILIDPPWNERGAGKCRRGADRHYKLLTFAEIYELLIDELVNKEQIGNPCHLYLWVTNNHLKEGLEILEALDFRYITNLVWAKDSFGLGQYFRGQHELCLFGVFGKTQLTLQRNLSTLITAKKREHSQKPLKMYDLIERASLPPRLEMFAREKRQGWDVWGIEAPSGTQSLLDSK